MDPWLFSINSRGTPMVFLWIFQRSARGHEGIARDAGLLIIQHGYNDVQSGSPSARATARVLKKERPGDNEHVH